MKDLSIANPNYERSQTVTPPFRVAVPLVNAIAHISSGSHRAIACNFRYISNEPLHDITTLAADFPHLMSTVTLTARRQLLLAAIPLGVPPGNTTLRHSCASERLNRSPARTRNVREQRPRAYPTPRQLFSLKTSPFGCDVGVKTSTFRGCEPADLPLSPLPCPHSNGGFRSRSGDPTVDDL